MVIQRFLRSRIKSALNKFQKRNRLTSLYDELKFRFKITFRQSTETKITESWSIGTVKRDDLTGA